jgi:hypothetical protein
MTYGYYITTYAGLALGRGLFDGGPRYTFQPDGRLLAALRFKNDYSKVQWDKTNTEVPANDPLVIAAIQAYPAMKLP